MLASLRVIFGLPFVLSLAFVLGAAGKDDHQDEVCELTPSRIGGSSSFALLQVKSQVPNLVTDLPDLPELVSVPTTTIVTTIPPTMTIVTTMPSSTVTADSVIATMATTTTTTATTTTTTTTTATTTTLTTTTTTTTTITFTTTTVTTTTIETTTTTTTTLTTTKTTMTTTTTTTATKTTLSTTANKTSTKNNILDLSSSRECSYELHEDQDGTKVCEHLKGISYISGRYAALDQKGYEDTVKLCCHHEMSLFVRREISLQGFDVCDLSDLHGFVHWYDCANDGKSYAEMKNEIAGVMGSECPWLGHLPTCPFKDPTHCGIIAACTASYPPTALGGDIAPLDQAGYVSVASRCCQKDMETYVRRVLDDLDFVICDEGAFRGFLHWYDCSDDDQTYAKLREGLVVARSGLPPLCPWCTGRGEVCPPKGHNCPVVEVPEPGAHRRRVACR